MNKGFEATLTVSSLSGNGTTVIRQDGMVFFVEKAVPGDTPRAKIWNVQKKYAETRAVEIITPRHCEPSRSANISVSTAGSAGK